MPAFILGASISSLRMAYVYGLVLKYCNNNVMTNL